MVLVTKAPKKKLRFVARPVPGFWTDVHLAAERFHGPMATAFIETMARAARAMNEDELTALLRAGHVGEAVKLFDKPKVQAAYEELVLPLEYEIMAAAARAAVPTVPGGADFVPELEKQAKPPDKGFRITAWFDLTNPEAIKAAALNAAELVTNITTATQSALREIVRRAQAQGLDIRTQARQIAKRLKEGVGLTRPQVGSLARMEAEWIEQGLNQTTINRLRKQARNRFIQQRATVIARHETMVASNTGVDQLWGQAEEHGLLPKTVKFEWIAQPALNERNPCKFCRPLDGKKKKRGEMFRSPVPPYPTTLYPPLHILCMCVLVPALET